MTHPSFSFTPDSPVVRIETALGSELRGIISDKEYIASYQCMKDTAFANCQSLSRYRQVNDGRNPYPSERSNDYTDLRALYPLYTPYSSDENPGGGDINMCEDALVHRLTGDYRVERRQMLKAKRKILAQQNRLQEREKYIATLRQQLSLAMLEPIKTVPVDLDVIHHSLSRHPNVTHIKSWIKDSDLYIRVHLNPMEMSNAGSCNCQSEDDDCRLCDDHDNHYHIGTSALSFIWTPTSFQHTVGKLSGQRFKAYDGQHLVHPHWISDDRPCLGDFSDSIGTSQANGDLLSTILVYIEFLQSFNGQDCAGKFGWQWQKEYSNRITSVDEILPAEQTPTGDDVSDYRLTTSNAHAYQGPQPLAIGA